jgi:hypothetical protein
MALPEVKHGAYSPSYSGSRGGIIKAHEFKTSLDNIAEPNLKNQKHITKNPKQQQQKRTTLATNSVLALKVNLNKSFI